MSLVFGLVMQGGFITDFHKAKHTMSWKIEFINTEGQI